MAVEANGVNMARTERTGWRLGHARSREVILKDDVARRAEHHVDVVRVGGVGEVRIDMPRVVLLRLNK